MPSLDPHLGVPTCHGYVPMWEIDANNHWNTAYYFRAFQRASERFALIAGQAQSPGAATARVRHVRFFRELHPLDTFEIRSLRLPETMAPYTVAHILRHCATGALSASALDLGPGLTGDGVPLDAIAPRSLPAGTHAARDSSPLLARGIATITHVGLLRSVDFDHRGAFQLEAAFSRVSDGTGHLWGHIGLTPADFRRHGFGRANVESKCSLLADCRPGDTVQLVSWFGDIGARTFELCHQLEMVSSGKVLAAISNITMALDMQARRSAPLPQFLLDAFAPMLERRTDQMRD